MRNANTVVVLDFETTGLSPNCGDRAIEIGAVKLEDGKFVNRFQSLMNPGLEINSFIENYTGISNSMLKKAPPCCDVMAEFSDFVGDFNLVAHNASFDRKFLDNECSLINRNYGGDWACSMLTARRVYPDAPNHKLGTLVSFKDLPNDGTFHRALADAEMTSHLWLRMLSDISDQYDAERVDFTRMQSLSRISKYSVARFFQSHI